MTVILDRDEPELPDFLPDFEAQIAELAALRQAGIDKLTALGLTEDEARAIAGI